MALHVALLRVRGLPPEDTPQRRRHGAASCYATLRVLPDGPKRTTRAAQLRDDGQLVRSPSVAALRTLSTRAGCGFAMRVSCWGLRRAGA